VGFQLYMRATDGQGSSLMTLSTFLTWLNHYMNITTGWML